MNSPDAPITYSRDKFVNMSVPELIRHFEVEGFVIFPETLGPDLIARLKAELDSLPMRASFFTDLPCFAKIPPHTHGSELAGLIAHKPVTSFLETLMGDDLVFMHSFYVLSHPGGPELDVHTDFQPYGSTYSGWLESCPIRSRVLYYLDDAPAERAALRIIPRSHICFHKDAQPYRRYVRHADEVLIELKAGDAFVFAVRLFHGVTGNTTNDKRGMLEYDYRPTWSRPMQPVPEWTAEQLAHVPEEAQRFLKGRNHLDFGWEFDAKRASVDEPAPGMSPARWGDGK